MRKAAPYLLLSVLLGVACGNGSSDQDAPSTCDRLKAKYSECNVQYELSENCGMNYAPPGVECATTHCVLVTECEDLRQLADGHFYDNDFVACSAECGYTYSNMFECADGSGLTVELYVCDGEANCPDGSDEANCE